jgi:hypothetical protein
VHELVICQLVEINRNERKIEAKKRKHSGKVDRQTDRQEVKGRKDAVRKEGRKDAVRKEGRKKDRKKAVLLTTWKGAAEVCTDAGTSVWPVCVYVQVDTACSQEHV